MFTSFSSTPSRLLFCFFSNSSMCTLIRVCSTTAAHFDANWLRTHWYSYASEFRRKTFRPVSTELIYKLTVTTYSVSFCNTRSHTIRTNILGPRTLHGQLWGLILLSFLSRCTWQCSSMSSVPRMIPSYGYERSPTSAEIPEDTSASFNWA